MHEQVLLLAVATAKAGGNALLIDADNQYGGWVPIQEAVDSGSAFAVDTKPGLIALDLDTPELIDACRRLADEIDLSVLWVNSGRNMHAFINAGDRYNEIRSTSESLGIPPDQFRGNKPIRPPCSPHRLGLPTGLIDVTVEEALEILGPLDVEPLLRNLSPETLSLIEHGDDGRFGGNRSRLVMSVAARMKAAGYTLADFRAVMFNEDNAAGEKIREIEETRGAAAAHDETARIWERAHGDEITPDEISSHIDQARAAVMQHRWRGQAGNSQRAVMLALIHLAGQHMTMTPTFGVRTLALAAQLSDRTVRTALKALCGSGWLSRIKAGSPGHADGYRFEKRIEVTAPSNVHPQLDSAVNLILLGHPAWRNGSGLGKSAGQVWAALSEVPTTRAELATATGKSPPTVTKALRSLASHGLASRQPAGWVTAGDWDTLDAAAAATGATDRAADQVRAYDLQRQAYADHIAPPQPEANDGLDAWQLHELLQEQLN